MSYLYLEGFRDAIEAAAKVCEKSAKDALDSLDESHLPSVHNEVMMAHHAHRIDAKNIRALLPPPPQGAQT